MGSSLFRLWFVTWVAVIHGACASQQSVPREDVLVWTPSRHCTGEGEWGLPLPTLFPEGAFAVTYTQGRGARLQDAHEEMADRCFASAALYSMGEQRLWPAVADTEVYRFTWLPSFGPFLMVRAQRQGDFYELYAKQSSGALALDGTHRSRILLKSEWDELQRRLKDFAFWSRPRRQTSVDPPDDSDGSEWLLEGAQLWNYRAYQVYVPVGEREQEGLPEACLYLLELSGYEIPPSAVH